MAKGKGNLPKKGKFHLAQLIKNPDISRNLLMLATLFLLATMIGMFFLLYILQSSLTNSYGIQKKHQERYSFWMERVESYPNSPDVLYNAAVAAYDVKKYETSLKLVRKAIILDPEFEIAKEFEKDILKTYRK